MKKHRRKSAKCELQTVVEHATSLLYCSRIMCVLTTFHKDDDDDDDDDMMTYIIQNRNAMHAVKDETSDDIFTRKKTFSHTRGFCWLTSQRATGTS